MAEQAYKEAHAQGYPAVYQHLHWLFRIVLSGTFVYHGIDKFTAGIAGFAGAVGIPEPVAFLVAAGEIAVGLSLFVGGLPVPKAGWFTRLGGVGMSVIMLGAITLVHWGRWAFSPADGYPLGGMEYQTLLVLLGTYLALRGNDL